jgi:chromate transporter
LLYLIKPAVIAIILQALWKLAATAIKTKYLALIGAASVVLNFLGVNPLLVLAFAALLAGGPVWRKRNRKADHPYKLALWFVGGMGAATSAALTVPFSIARLFVSFLKIGSVVFGSGYVLLAFLSAEFISRLHWLTEKQLIDAVAVGQFTPGPVFTTATFIGYILGGIPGAFFATLGIFLPGFLLVAVSGPLIPMIRRSAVASAMLDGVVAGSLALMCVVAWQLGRAAVTDWLTVLVLIVSAVALLRFRLNSAWLIGAAALAGWFVKA